MTSFLLPFHGLGDCHAVASDRPLEVEETIVKVNEVDLPRDTDCLVGQCAAIGPGVFGVVLRRERHEQFVVEVSRTGKYGLPSYFRRDLTY